MIILNRNVILLFFAFLFVFDTAAQQGRLENEYKLSIPDDEVEALWQYLQDEFCKENLKIDIYTLNGVKSVEKFKDTYFDNEQLDLLALNIGLRYRKRYKDDILLKTLIQLKTPYSADEVVRNEFKYEPIKKKNTDIDARHPVLKYLDKSSRESMVFELAPYKVRINDLAVSVNLTQVRSRIYLSDPNGESVATLTLDQVTNNIFPYQKYAEMELEINEVRYTHAEQEEKQMLIDINEYLKNNIQGKFTNLKVDQSPKYNKMKQMIDGNLFSKLRDSYMWILFGFILLSVGYKYIKQ